MKNARKNLTIATDINGKGGVSTVLKVLRDTGFNNKVSTTLISSHSNGKAWFGLKRFLAFGLAIVKLSFYGVFYKLGIVHIHMSSRGSYMRKSLLVRLAKKLGATVILHLHGAEFKQFYYDECDTSKQAHIRQTYNLADCVIVLSTQWKVWLDTLVENPDKVRVVYNAVIAPDLVAKATEKQEILFLGRLGERKGVGDLLQAYALIHQQCPNSQLTIGGDGDIAKYKRQAQQLGIADKVVFLGWVAGQEKVQHLANAYIYSLPSYNEGFPMGVLEAMSAKIPVVSTTAGGIPDAITDNQDGFLLEAGDITGLADTLKMLLLDEKLSHEIGQAGYEKYHNNFSPEIVTGQLKAIYQELEQVQ